jgi:hypothetical protein
MLQLFGQASRYLTGEAGEGALAQVSEEASGADFPYDYFLFWRKSAKTRDVCLA